VSTIGGDVAVKGPVIPAENFAHIDDWIWFSPKPIHESLIESRFARQRFELSRPESSFPLIGQGYQ